MEELQPLFREMLRVSRDQVDTMSMFCNGMSMFNTVDEVETFYNDAYNILDASLEDVEDPNHDFLIELLEPIFAALKRARDSYIEMINALEG